MIKDIKGGTALSKSKKERGRFHQRGQANYSYIDTSFRRSLL